MPSVSVLIATYNRADMLDEALRSVFAQTYRDFEVIVVDDGSRDHTRSVVGRYGPRINYIFQENQGPSSARNAGIAVARGEYLAFLDDDDTWLPTKLELQARLLDGDPDVDVVYGGCYFVREKHRILFSAEDPPPPDRMLDRFLENRFMCCPSCILVRARVIERIGGFDPGQMECEDWLMWAKITAFGGRFACVREPVAEKREHKSARSFSNFEGVHAGRLLALEKLFGFPEIPVRLRAKRRFYLARAFACLGLDRYSALQLRKAWSAWAQAISLDPSAVPPEVIFVMFKSLLGQRLLRCARHVRRVLLPTLFNVWNHGPRHAERRHLADPRSVQENGELLDHSR